MALLFASPFALILLAATAGSAQSPGASPATPCEGVPVAAGTSIAAKLVADGFRQPIHLAAPPKDSERLFIVEQVGTIRILKEGKPLARPFLDIRDRVRSGGERGLLSVAFHPDYPSTRRFFVYYTDSAGDLIIAAFTTTPADADLADPGSERRLLIISHRKYGNHNGGQLVFGPDRFLYIGTGDGGSGGDPDNNAQSKTSLLGKLLRIDVDKPGGGKPYGIPASNPFLRDRNAAPEVWAYGLRNPWRFSFDRTTGDLYIADVGQSSWEEVNLQPASSQGGENYGWRYMEGKHCFDPPKGCSTQGMRMPVIEYPTPPGAAITGGYVYRGCRMPALRGTYFYADYLKGFIRSFVLADGKVARERDVTRDLTPPNATLHLSSFGEDARGELYLVDHQQGAVYRIIPRNEG